jgi:uncharacterized protein (TIGR03435 family)
MIPESLSPVANHLWQSTLFAGAAGLLTLALRNNPARVRHAIWVVASLKFLVPFSLLIALGSQVQWRTAALTPPAGLSVVLDQVSQPFAPPAPPMLPMSTASEHAGLLPAVLWIAWACGFVVLSALWWVRWRRIAAAVRSGSALPLGLPIRVISSPAFIEPGVFGVFRPVMVLPGDLFARLTPEQWSSVLTHELCHVRRRDNLIGALQMFVETVFWFHPLVWWVGTRIVHERERACDEEVLRLGSEPRTYAQGILRVCELYLESPVPCVAGVSGSNLKNRIRDIMSRRIATELSGARKAALAVAGTIAVAVPIVVGMSPARAAFAQASSQRFEVASIRPTKECATLGSRPAQGRLSLCGALSFFIQASYDVYSKERGFTPGVMTVAWTANLEGAPDWLNSELYQIEAKAEGNPPSIVMSGPMLQALFEERLKLKARFERRVVPVYEMTAVTGGPKLERSETTCVPFDPTKPPAEPPPPGQAAPRPCGGLSIDKGTIVFSEMTLSDFSQYLGRNIVRRPIIDKVSMPGRFNFRLTFAPDENTPLLRRSDNDTGPSIFTALQEQLGLKLEPAKGPHDILVIDSVERPSEN